MDIGEFLLDTAISSIFELPSPLRPVPEILTSLLDPSNYFGLFVTITRSSPDRRKHSVHGCHGYWTERFAPFESVDDLLIHLREIAFSSAYFDSRKLQFRKPLEKKAASSYCEINLLKTRFTNIDKNTGLIKSTNNHFDNLKNGILVVPQSRGHTATFLPEVFDESTSWVTIRDQLLSKGSVPEDDNNYELFSYETTSYKKSIFDLLNCPYLRNFIAQIGISAPNGLNDILQFLSLKSFGQNAYKSSSIFLKKWKEIPIEVIPFLLFGLRNDSSSEAESLKSEMCHRLVKKYGKDDEPVSQAINAITAIKVSCPGENVSELEERMVEAMRSLTNPTLDDLQSLRDFTWYLKESQQPPSNDAHLVQKRMKEIIRAAGNFYSLDSYYLALAFEALCILRLILKPSNDKIDNAIFYLFYLLSKTLLQPTKFDLSTTFVLRGFESFCPSLLSL